MDGLPTTHYLKSDDVHIEPGRVHPVSAQSEVASGPELGPLMAPNMHRSRLQRRGHQRIVEHARERPRHLAHGTRSTEKGRKPDDVGSILDLAAHGITSAALDRWLI
jgi:hypothetical protein